ncbi:heavy metal translocating P-type ATPase [Georgenia sp. Z1491]|uniref:heavy metal translocating P-type ATPase n=1 Tax=Georgenia sp. Z1491 TaxID=3416707 RepID=UPI003CE82D18
MTTSARPDDKNSRRAPTDLIDATDLLGEAELEVEGMTCASCVRRVEKKLNAVEGVAATVNLATDSAHVELSADVDDDTLVAALRAAGYDGQVTSRTRLGAPEPVRDSGEHAHHDASGHAEHDAAGHGGHDHSPLGDDSDTYDTSTPTQRRAADLRRRLLVALVLGVPVGVLSMVPPLQFAGWQWVVMVLALPIATWCAWPFHTAAVRAARHGASTMDTLVSLGVVASTLWSLWAITLGGAGEIGMRMEMTLWPAAGGHDGGHAPPHLYFETAVLIVVFLLLGRYLEARSRHRAGDSLRSLLELGAKDVARVHIADDGTRTEERVPVERLAVDELFVVRPGEKIATDGVVVEGASAVDAALLTGESLPVEVGPGDAVTGATISTSGSLLVRATRVGEETTLAQIGRLVTRAQTGKAPVQRLADRVSAVFVPVVIGIAIAVLAGWLLAGGSVEQAFTAAVAVLVIACPCALGLATPTALLVGTGRAANLGVLIKGPEILESTRRIDTVVLDKTGTVTAGRIALVDVSGEPDALAVAAAVEAGSEHPVARAITEAAAEQGAALPAVEDFENHAGRGVSARVAPASPGTSADSSSVRFPDLESAAPADAGRATAPDADVVTALVGRPSWLAEQGVDLGEHAAAHAAAEETGATAVVVAWDGSARGVLSVRDTVRPDAAEAVAKLRGLGLTAHLLTGDNDAAARQAAATVGIATENVTAGVLPADKVTVVERLQAGGRVVAMVGDGVNDAAALAQADLGLAMGTGTDIAIEAADLTLVRTELDAVPTSVRISRATLRVIKQNLFWAFAYNVAAIPLAAAGLLNPGIAAAAMAASSVIVVLNSLRLRSAG